MERRLCCIPCNARFEDNVSKDDFEEGIFKKDISYIDEDKFPSQHIKEAFLRFCVCGAQRYFALRNQGKRIKDMEPDCVRQATREYMLQNNPLLKFIKDITGPDNQRITLMNLYYNYEHWWEGKHQGMTFRTTFESMKKNLKEMHFDILDQDQILITGDNRINEPVFKMQDKSNDVEFTY